MATGDANVTNKPTVIRLIVLTGVLAFAFLFFVRWGLGRSLIPPDSQRVKVWQGQSPFDGKRAYRDLEHIVGIGPRVPGTEGSAKAREYIINEMRKAGIEVRVEPFEALTPLGPRPMANVVAVVQGDRDGVLILGNHYDTKYLPDIHFVGANDGGSTTAWMIEMARTFGPKRKGYTLWLCWFDGEEAFKEWTLRDSLYGSRSMAARLKESGEISRIKAMINVDMIGDCYLSIFKEPAATPWLSDIIWKTAEDLRYGAYFMEFGQEMKDDHVPFLEAGVPAVNIIDFRYGGTAFEHKRIWHTANDTIDKVCWESLQAVGDVIYTAIFNIEDRLIRLDEE